MNLVKFLLIALVFAGIPISAGASFISPVQPDGAAFTLGTSPELMPGSCVNATTTIAAGKSGVLTCDGNGNLKVTLGATSSAPVATVSNFLDSGTFTQGTTPVTPFSGLYSTSIVNLLSGESGALQETKERRLVAEPYAKTEDLVHGAATTTGTASTLLISAIAATRICVTEVSVSNTASAISVISLQDGSGGATMYYIPAPSAGGAVPPLPSPICTTAGNGLYFASSIAATTIYISAGGYTAQ